MMPVDSRVADLLEKWEEAKERGDEPSVDEICRDCPQLVEKVLKAIAALKEIDSRLRVGQADDGRDDRSGEHTRADCAAPLTQDREFARAVSALRADELIQAISQRGLLTEAELRAYRADLNSDGDDAAVLAEEFIDQGILTRFQLRVIGCGENVPLVLGDYVIREPIGAGGMGQVYKALHRRMKREVALKVLRPHFAESDARIRRFEREVEAAAKLSHENIVRAYDAGEQDGVHYLIMEFVDGLDLYRVVGTSGPLPIAAAVRYVIQAARGLHYAHGEGIIHRDIKPSNLLLTNQGTIKILDMGIARFDKGAPAGDTGELTATGAVVGTVDYLAPEQAFAPKTADRRADVYSLGCTAWFLLTGKSVYGGDTATQRLLAHREAPIPSLRTLRTDVPQGLEDIVRKMIAKKPSDRYESADQVVAALQALADRELERTDNLRVPSRKRERSRRTVVLFSLIGILLLATIAVVAVQIGSRYFSDNSKNGHATNDPKDGKRLGRDGEENDGKIAHPPKKPKDGAIVAQGGPAQIRFLGDPDADQYTSWILQPTKVRIGLPIGKGHGLTAAEFWGRGARIMKVAPGTSAAKAGVKPGDLVVRVDDQSIRFAQQFLQSAAAPVARGAPKLRQLTVLRFDKKSKYECVTSYYQKESRNVAPGAYTILACDGTPLDSSLPFKDKRSWLLVDRPGASSCFYVIPIRWNMRVEPLKTYEVPLHFGIRWERVNPITRGKDVLLRIVDVENNVEFLRFLMYSFGKRSHIVPVPAGRYSIQYSISGTDDWYTIRKDCTFDGKSVVTLKF